MAHTVSGLIRKTPHIAEASNSNGVYTMFCFELSEFNKGTQGNDNTYTNYSVALFAKTPGAIEFHRKAIADGSFVVVGCDKLTIDKQTGADGKEYIKLKMMNASLSDFNNPNAQAPQQAQQGGYQQAPQHQPQQSYQQQAQQQPPRDAGGFTQAQGGFQQQAQQQTAQQGGLNQMPGK